MNTDTEFIDMVLYFLEEKGDPTRYIRWDEDRAMRLLPFVTRCWHALSDEQHILRLAVAEAREKLG